jgi:hypothetical protein
LGARTSSDGARLSYNSGGSNMVNNLVNGVTPGGAASAAGAVVPGSKPATLHRLLSAVGQLALGGPELLADLYQQQVVPPLPAAALATPAAGAAAGAAAAGGCRGVLGAAGVVAARTGSCGRLLAALPSLAAVQDMAAAHASQAVAEGWAPCRDMPLFL